MLEKSLLKSFRKTLLRWSCLDFKLYGVKKFRMPSLKEEESTFNKYRNISLTF